MERTTGRVDETTLVEVSVVLQLVTEEFTRDVQGFTSDDNNLLTVKGLLSDDGSKTTKQMTLRINDQCLFEGTHS